MYRFLCCLALLLLALGSGAALAAPRCLSDCSPRIGIVSAFGAEADILLASTRHRRQWRINGNLFTTGELAGNKVVIVLSGVSIVNATMTTQLLLDHFRIERLLLSGIAGGIDPARHVGDVLVPERWAMPMEVYWNGDASLPAACGKTGDIGCLGLKLATGQDGQPLPDYRPQGRPSGLFLRENFVMNAANSPRGEYRFDYEADPEMLAVARAIHPVLDRCGPREPLQCVEQTPQLHVGGRGISGSAFLANPDYRAYLFETLSATAVDMETAALGHVARANSVPFIAFRSLSDLAGGSDFREVGAFFGSGLAETNEARVTLAFLEAWKKRGAR
ncbi:5'-methylthioadenosine/S-adenosylhomocysteine nucleosidase [Niveibacterium terrae]|uniref:5'-methylthioadenosine/S-adenosylhomocysteine nucleosidase n=1 Tax=Niveibacterium terrae TaxID=3373598 RepID=UPI003A90D064